MQPDNAPDPLHADLTDPLGHRRKNASTHDGCEVLGCWGDVDQVVEVPMIPIVDEVLHDAKVDHESIGTNWPGNPDHEPIGMSVQARALARMIRDDVRAVDGSLDDHGCVLHDGQW